MTDAKLPRGIIPPGTYAGGGRSPIVYAYLCPPCGGYAPLTDEDYDGALSGRCQGCGAESRELHRFQALILSAANGGCMCDSGHPQVTGDLPTEASAGAVMTEVRTRPAPLSPAEQARRAEWRRSLRGGTQEEEAAAEKCRTCAFPATCSEFGRCALENLRTGGGDD